MTDTPSTDTSDRPLSRDILYAVRYYLGSRRILYVLAGVLILGGIALNWGWLVAAGLAPILLTLLPCAVMCALGLCMHKMTGGAHGGRQGAGAQDAGLAAADPIDPVSRRSVPAGATTIASVHQGQVYFFESPANREAFEAEPEKFFAGSQAIDRPPGAQDGSGKDSPGGRGCCG